MGTGPVNIRGLPSSSLNFVVPFKNAKYDQNMKIRMCTSAQKNHVPVADDDDTMTGQGNRELIHGGLHTIVPYLLLNVSEKVDKTKSPLTVSPSHLPTATS